MLKRILFLAFISIIFYACTKEKNAPKRSMYYEYYPLEENLVWIYDVDSTFYDKFYNPVRITNYSFEIKDTVTGFYTNLTGDIVYRIERYKKTDDSPEWQYQRNFTRSVTSRRAEETIDNQTFIIFIFPPVLYESWNGNSKNTLGKQDYRITDFPTSIEVNNTVYDSVVVISQINETNLIQEDIVSEVYAKNKGLIKKDFRSIEKNISNGQILHGTIYTMQLKDSN